MASVFNVTSDDIARLSDTDFRELIARLSEAELKRASHSTSYVTWGGDQRAKDGGTDVRVALPSDVRVILPDTAQISGYVPKPSTCFQVKAEVFPRSKIEDEMMPKGVIRPVIKEIANARGAYIIASSKGSLADSALADRLSAMQDCLKKAGLQGQVLVDFYDRRRIATWVEQHPALVAWTRQKVGRALSGWKPYGPWAFFEDNADAEYVLDKQVKVFAPNNDEGLEAQVAIDQIRQTLSKGQSSVRIVGLSGVGKTRLVQALFDDRLQTSADALDKGAALYTDLSDAPDPQPIAMAEALVLTGEACTLIVDNCGADLHQRITEVVKRSTSNLRIVTVEYDIRDDLPEGTSCYRLEPSSDDLIETLVQKRYPALSPPDIDKIAEFAGGNARVAFALAGTSTQGGELSRLQDEALFRRLFNQNNDPNDDLLRSAEVCSLLYSLNGKATSGADAELPLLANIAEATISKLSSHIAELQRRGLIQKRGVWRAVLPHAISNRLAQRALQNIPSDILISQLVDTASERVARSFLRRLGFLHQSNEAREIVIDWLSDGGRLADLANADDLDREMFRNVAPVAPRSALSAIQRARKAEQFLSTDNYYRWIYARTVRSIAYDADLFKEAVEILTAFSLKEPVGYNNNSVRATLQSLFYVHLSGTHATPVQRAEIIESLLSSKDPHKADLGLLLLDAALQTSGFSSHYGFEFGARKRDFGWHPRTQKDINHWYSIFISLAVKFGSEKTALAPDARAAVGRHLSGLLADAKVFDIVESAAQELQKVDGWAEGWLGVKQALLFRTQRFNDQELEHLKQLEAMLEPKDVLTTVRARVLSRSPVSLIELDDDEKQTPEAQKLRWERSQSEAHRLGTVAALDGQLLAILLPDLVTSQDHLQTWNFAKGVGETLPDPSTFLQTVRDQLTKTDPKKVGLRFICGFLNGAHSAHPESINDFLDTAVTDPVFGPYFPQLQTAIDLDAGAVSRLLKSLEAGLAPTSRFRSLGGGRSTDPLSIQDLDRLISAIAAKPDAQDDALDILRMVIHCAEDKDAVYQNQLRTYCQNFLSNIDWSLVTHNSEYVVGEILEYAIEGIGGQDCAVQLCRAILQNRKTKPYQFIDYGILLGPLLKRYPEAMLDEIFVPDADGSYGFAVSLLGDEDRLYRKPAIDEADSKVLIDWCLNGDPNKRFPFIAACCRMFNREADEVGEEAQKKLKWTDIVEKLIQHAPDKSAIIQIFASRIPPMSWSGSRAAMIYERIALLDELNVDEGEEVVAAISEAKRQINDLADKEAAAEEREEKERNERFE